jgi:hypothetical protein
MVNSNAETPVNFFFFFAENGAFNLMVHTVNLIW